MAWRGIPRDVSPGHSPFNRPPPIPGEISLVNAPPVICQSEQTNYYSGSCLMERRLRWALISARAMTTNSPQRWHLMTTPRCSSRAVSRPQTQRTSCISDGASGRDGIRHGSLLETPLLYRTYEPVKTPPCRLLVVITQRKSRL